MRLSDLLSTANVIIPIKAKDRDSSIREIIETMKNDVPDIEEAYKAVLEREMIMTTGVGNEIAIPHCKYPETNNFIIGLGIARQGINFNSIDHKDVKLIFLLIGPEDDSQNHIKMLSRISRIMHNSEFRSKLIESSSATEALRLIEEEEKNHSNF